MTQPKLRFAQFDGDWNTQKLEHLASFSKGNGYSKSDLVEFGTPIILYGSLYTDYQTAIHTTRTFVKQKEKSVISTGNEVIVPASGETAQDIARASAVINPNIILGGDLNIIKPNQQINNIFLALTLSCGRLQKELSAKAQGKSVVHLRNNDLKKLDIFYPTLAEQTTIGNFFRQVDKLIALHQGKLDNIKTLKKGLLQKMFPKQGETVPQIRFPQFTDAWEQRKLGEVVEKAKSYSLSRNVEVAEFTGFKYIHYGDIHRGVANIIHSDEILPNIQTGNFELLKQGDLVLADASEDYEGVGACCVIDCFSKNNLVAGLHTIAIRPIKTDHLFLYYLLNTQTFKRYGRFVGTGTKVVAISPTNLLKFKTNIPTNPTEQTTIGHFFHQLDKLITLHQRKLGHLKTLKKALLQQMFV